MASTAYLPALLALAAAFLFALSAHVQNIGLQGGDARAGTLITIASTAAVYWLAAPLLVASSYWLTGATVLFALTGLFRPALSINLWVRGIKLLGPTLNAALSATGPIFAAAFALLLLGEHVTLPVALGTLAVVAGVAVAYLRRDGGTLDWPAWALVLSLGAAFLRAAAHAITKLGFAEVANPFFAGLVSNTVSLILVFLVFWAKGRRFDGSVRDYRWFVVAGLINALAVYLLNQAPELGQGDHRGPDHRQLAGIRDAPGVARVSPRGHNVANGRDDRAGGAGRGPRRREGVSAGATFPKREAMPASASIGGNDARSACRTHGRHLHGAGTRADHLRDPRRDGGRR